MVKVWITRLLVLAVFAVNVYCALAFIIFPEKYLFAYELTGTAGAAAIQGIGVAFLMWNVTYPPVIVHPDRFRMLFIIVLVQQIVGLVGEVFILLTLPEGHGVLAGNIMRFIAFDAGGLVLLFAGFFLSRKSRRPRSKPS